MDTIYNITATGLTNCCSSTPGTSADGTGGLTGTGSGSMQEFARSAGADTLLLGFVDGGNFVGTPRLYSDNTGSLEVTVNAALAPITLPAGLPLLIGALGWLGLMRRRASAKG